VTVTPDDRIRIDLADPSQLQTVSGVATAPGMFHIVGIPADRTEDVVEGEPLAGDMRTAPIIGPGHIADAWLGQDDLGQPVVNLEFDAQAAEAFDAWAVDHVGERVALLLDDVVVSAPVLQATRFDGRTQISGSFDTSRVQELVAILRGGPLPVLAEPLPDCLPIGCPIPSQPPGVTAPP
jgi:preprotein translocase subunit SecD